MKIRLFEQRDAPQIAQLFHDTVRTINRRDYSQAQVEAWAPDNVHFKDWAKTCSSSNNRFTFVAVDDKSKANQICGFAELQVDGHIDCFYSHVNYQRCGVGRLLYQAMEQKARNELHLSRLDTAASITARPFFERMGFVTVRQQTVSSRGQDFINYIMEKKL